MPSLYVVATPIGNLEDVTLRALRVLREVTLVAAEDTRKTRRLLDAYDIRTPTTSYHERNKWTKMEHVLGKLAEGDVALVSEAGMPGISDPGHELIVKAIEHGFPVTPVPGPSAIDSALVVSGLPTQKFVFLGFPPHKAGDRRRIFESVSAESGTLVVLESPHRITASLADVLSVLGDRRMAVCRELTKLHEEVFRGTVSQAMAHFAEPRGEFTLVIEGCTEAAKPVKPDVDAASELAGLRARGLKAKEAIALVSGQTGVSRKELYRLWLGK
jgi:16S rRNA (cytidine1402-2'-O)-methyltransferase